MKAILLFIQDFNVLSITYVVTVIGNDEMLFYVLGSSRGAEMKMKILN